MRANRSAPGAIGPCGTSRAPTGGMVMSFVPPRPPRPNGAVEGVPGTPATPAMSSGAAGCGVCQASRASGMSSTGPVAPHGARGQNPCDRHPRNIRCASLFSQDPFFGGTCGPAFARPQDFVSTYANALGAPFRASTLAALIPPRIEGMSEST